MLKIFWQNNFPVKNVVSKFKCFVTVLIHITFGSIKCGSSHFLYSIHFHSFFQNMRILNISTLWRNGIIEWKCSHFSKAVPQILHFTININSGHDSGKLHSLYFMASAARPNTIHSPFLISLQHPCHYYRRTNLVLLLKTWKSIIMSN